MPWNTLILMFAFIATVTLVIGIAFYSIGLKLILPFSGLDVLLLGTAFYLCARRGSIKQVVHIDPDGITVECGREGPETTHIFKRAWARAELERSWNSWYPSRLLLRSHGKQLELGDFLNEQERQGLALELQSALQQ